MSRSSFIRAVPPAPPVPLRIARQERSARAYGGRAHGIRWAVAADRDPAPAVDLLIDGALLRYQVVRHPLARRPARDDHGDYLYMPSDDLLHPTA